MESGSDFATISLSLRSSATLLAELVSIRRHAVQDVQPVCSSGIAEAGLPGGEAPSPWASHHVLPAAVTTIPCRKGLGLLVWASSPRPLSGFTGQTLAGETAGFCPTPGFCPKSLKVAPVSRTSLAVSASRRAAVTDAPVGPIFLLPVRSRKLPCRPLPSMAAANEPTRRSHLRKIMNAIIRRRNEVAPAEIKAVEGHLERFDANSLGGGDPHHHGGVEDPSGLPPVQQKSRKRILILMSDTGGGHRASAEALKATFELEYGSKYEIAIVDAWKDHTPFPFNQMPKSYSFLVKHESLWRMAFYATKPRFVHQPQMAATSVFVAREFAKMLDFHRPDLIVSVHPLMQHIPIRVLRTRGLLHRIPFTTVITDLTTCHPTWFHRLATTCFCPTKEVAQRALKAGLTPPQLRVHGLPVRPSFSRPPDLAQDELRRELGMDPDLPAVILIGGGEGMGPVEATARALASVLASKEGVEGEGAAKGQLFVVCGRNKKLKAKLEAVSWPIPVQIRGFVTNMPDVMAACNCIITKAGPGTIAESLIRGLPLVLNDFIAGQEVGNIPYVVDNGAGFFCEDPKKIAEIVADWFGPKAAEFAKMAENAKKLARPDAVFRIVRDLDSLACGEKLLSQSELTLLPTS